MAGAPLECALWGGDLRERAAGSTSTGSATEALYEYQNGALTSLGTVLACLASEWDYAAWIGPNYTLLFRDLAAQVTSTVKTDAEFPSDISSTGELLYDSSRPANADVQIFRYSSSSNSSSLFTSDTISHREPEFDGHTAVYLLGAQLPIGPRSLARNTGAGETLLVANTTKAMQYRVNNGWVLYSLNDASSSQVWSVSPSGTSVPVTTGTFIQFEALGPAGQLVYNDGRRRYVAVPNGSTYAAFDIGNSTLGKAFWIDGQLYVAIGGNLLKVAD